MDGWTYKATEHFILICSKQNCCCNLFKSHILFWCQNRRWGSLQKIQRRFFTLCLKTWVWRLLGLLDWLFLDLTYFERNDRRYGSRVKINKGFPSCNITRKGVFNSIRIILEIIIRKRRNLIIRARSIHSKSSWCCNRHKYWYDI